MAGRKNAATDKNAAFQRAGNDDDDGDDDDDGAGDGDDGGNANVALNQLSGATWTLLNMPFQLSNYSL